MIPACAPSWVVPGTAARNAAFLQGRVAGIMLCAFEAAPRLPSVLPDRDHGLEWHVHLPVDLPWPAGGAQAAQAARTVVTQARHLLGPGSLYVLHPPANLASLEEFVRVWAGEGLNPASLLLENLPDCPPGVLLQWAKSLGLSICLDVAHLVLSNDMAHAIQDAAITRAARMAHWSAPCDGKDCHGSLSGLDASSLAQYKTLAARLSGAVHVIEVFTWDGVLSSWRILRTWLSQGDPAG